MNNQLENQLNSAYKSDARNESRHSPLRFSGGASDQPRNGRKLGHGNKSTFNPLMPDAGGPGAQVRHGRMLGHGNKSYNPLNPGNVDQSIGRPGRMLGHNNQSYNPIVEQKTNPLLSSSKEIMRSNNNLSESKINFFKNTHNFYGLEDHRPPTSDIKNNSSNYADPNNIQSNLRNYSSKKRNVDYSGLQKTQISPETSQCSTKETKTTILRRLILSSRQYEYDRSLKKFYIDPANYNRGDFRSFDPTKFKPKRIPVDKEKIASSEAYLQAAARFFDI